VCPRENAESRFGAFSVHFREWEPPWPICLLDVALYPTMWHPPEMTHFPQSHPRRRAARVNMAKPVSVMVVREDGQHSNCTLQTVSVTGGLLQVAQLLSQGDFVEVAFQTSSSTVHGMAKMLKAIPQAEGLLQAFRFIALDDEDHRTLRTMTDAADDQNTFLPPPR
jgi:hypothetical protein